MHQPWSNAEEGWSRHGLEERMKSTPTSAYGYRDELRMDGRLQSRLPNPRRIPLGIPFCYSHCMRGQQLHWFYSSRTAPPPKHGGE